ncbi:MAG: single-stranded-DNA-specific exonuclease RecJ [Pelagibacteraceae bacterium]|nr:single-stranded-DNA-specific exonuclease RecJ [Pelagibacteraceae bacterium]
MLIEKSFSNKTWELKKLDERQSLMIAQRYGLSDLISKILTHRKLEENKIQEFLNPNIRNNFPEPFTLKDMKESVERTYKSIIFNEKIGVIADYDVDGSTSAAILTRFFNEINININIEIPKRITEGYGPNQRIINLFKKNNIKLIISLDCGTTAFKVFDKELKKEIDTIVIDHHVSEDKFPIIFGLINPNRYDENNNLQDLAAVGVTFIFLVALRRKLREENYYKKNNLKEHNLTSYLDLVALGTVCDVVPLKNINRSFVVKGLEILYQRLNIGLSNLIDSSNIRHQPKVFDLSFLIGPKLNSAGRIGDSTLSAKILYSNNIVEVESISKKLDLLNKKRKLIETQILQEAKIQAEKNYKSNVIIVSSFDWHPGVIGIVASRLVEEFSKPVIIISKNKNFGIGSARSVPHINLGSLIIESKNQGLLIEGGGHKMAAGLKIFNNKIELFSQYINDKINNYKKSINNYVLKYDFIIELEQINDTFLENLEILEPYGQGNPEPIFLIQNLQITQFKVINDKHIFLILTDQRKNSIKAMSFNSINTRLGSYLTNNDKNKINIITSVKRDNFLGNNSTQLLIIDGCYSN